MQPSLSHAHQKTYDAILRHPAAHNLQWRDVRSMLGAFAEVVDEPNGTASVTRNGQTFVLHPERHKDVGTEEQLKELLPHSWRARVKLLCRRLRRRAPPTCSW